MIDLSRRLLQGVVRTWLKTALDPARPVSGQRKMIATAARLLPPPGRVRSVNQLPGGLPGVRIDPPSSDGGRGAILYLHGGGYVLGSPATHRNVAARLSWLTGLPVLLPKYRLAPEARWPAAREDACAAWRGLIESGFDADQSVIAGDSAGGGLAVAVAQQAAAEGSGLPAALVCFSPWVDLGLGGATIESLAGVDPMLTPRWLAWAARTYLGGHPA
ncbi:MAG: alpha/beta hydrolase fold domain-containing protein, partial [Gammaproteobacteria bacterium]